MGYTLLRRVFLLFMLVIALQKEPIIWRKGTYSDRYIALAASQSISIRLLLDFRCALYIFFILLQN
jgi:hypothetical protein